MLSSQERAIVQYGLKHGKSREEILAALMTYRQRQQRGNVFTRVLRDIPQDISQAVQEGKQAWKQAGEEIVSTIENPRLSLADKVLGAGSSVFRGIGRTIGSVAGAVLRLPFTQRAENKAEALTTKAVSTLAKTRPARTLISHYQQLPEDTKRYIRYAGGFAEGGLALLGGRGVSSLKEAVAPSAQTATLIVRQKAGSAAPTVSKIASAVKRPLTRLYPKRFRGDVASAEDIVGGIVQQEGGKVRIADAQTIHREMERAIDRAASLLEEAVSNEKSLHRRLGSLARTLSTDNEQATVKDLLRGIIAEGVIPELKGDRMSFDESIRSLQARRKRLFEEEIVPTLERIQKPISLEQVYKRAKAFALSNANTVELPRIMKQIASYMDTLAKKYRTTNLTPLDAYREKVMLNNATKAYKRAEDIYKADAADIIAKALRDEVYALDKSLVEKAAEMERLIYAERIARILDGTKAPSSEFVKAIGRFLATVGASSLGAGIAVSGSAGALVLAGIVAMSGEQAALRLVRRLRLPKTLRAEIEQAIREMPELRKRLIRAGMPKTFRVKPQ